MHEVLEYVSPRSRQVAELTLQNMNTREIAAEMGITVDTVKKYLTKVFMTCRIEGKRSKRIKLINMLRPPQKQLPTLVTLSPRDLSIVQQVAEGANNAAIGRLIGTTEQVIKNYIQTILDKAGCWTRVELAGWYAVHSEALIANSATYIPPASIGNHNYVRKDNHRPSQTRTFAIHLKSKLHNTDPKFI